MRPKTLWALLMMLSLVPMAAAQTKVSGTVACQKPDQQQAIEVGDRPGHVFSITQSKCSWTKPIDVGSTQTKDDVVTFFDEIRGNTSASHGYVVQTLASGDQAIVRVHGKGMFKDGKPQGSEGQWTYVRGAGKAKGAKGQGTYKCEAAGEGMNCSIEGEMENPK